MLRESQRRLRLDGKLNKDIINEALQTRGRPARRRTMPEALTDAQNARQRAQLATENFNRLIAEEQNGFFDHDEYRYDNYSTYSDEDTTLPYMTDTRSSFLGGVEDSYGRVMENRFGRRRRFGLGEDELEDDLDLELGLGEDELDLDLEDELDELDNDLSYDEYDFSVSENRFGRRRRFGLGEDELELNLDDEYDLEEEDDDDDFDFAVAENRFTRRNRFGLGEDEYGLPELDDLEELDDLDELGLGGFDVQESRGMVRRARRPLGESRRPLRSRRVSENRRFGKKF